MQNNTFKISLSDELSSDILFVIPKKDESFLDIQLNGNLSGASVSLTNPLSEPAVTHNAPDLMFVAAAQRYHPRLGDFIQLPTIKNPRPGTWRLRLNRPQKQQETITLTLNLQKRIQVHLLRDRSIPLKVGQSLIFRLVVTDYYEAVTDLKAMMNIHHDGVLQKTSFPFSRNLEIGTDCIKQMDGRSYLSCIPITKRGTYRFESTVEMQGRGTDSTHNRSN